MPKGLPETLWTALFWDLEAKLAGERIWELPDISKHLKNDGKSKTESVTTVYTLSLDTPEKMGEAAAKHASRPYLKIKLTGDGDLERLTAISENAPNSRLVVDANRGWTLEHYQRFVPELKSLELEMIEQPFPADKDSIPENTGPASPSLR